jgi:LPXTG-motif cell wall-anchored protein
MTADPTPPTPSQSGVVAYTFLCLTALLAMVLVLMENEHELLFIVLLAAVGAVGVMARWRAAPLLLLLGLAVLELYYRATWTHYSRGFDWRDTVFTDAVLCAAVLAYSAGQYRLVALSHSVFPIDTRRRPMRVPRSKLRQQRSPHLPQTGEIVALAITAAGVAVAVSLYWLVLSVIPAPLGMMHGLWRGLLLIFTMGLTTAGIGAVVVYVDWLKATPTEHLLFLQDQAWRETRREQNRINRYLTWARLRGQRRKEKK